ncbi:MAG: two component, sigma54 specific, transcriptional regulator, Fis family, partial [Deltaproteobacteria bacterium]|nr:two component, sigma54 specific, transcriptional regulator, Fis family [Deltaproteobacteria bacterium]
MNIKGFPEPWLADEKQADPHANADRAGENREFTLFRRVQGAMSYAPDFVETCKAVLNAVMDGIDAENCSIMLKDPVSGELRVRAARGKSDGKTVYYGDSSPKGKKFKPGEGIAGWVLKEGQAVVTDDVKDEPRFVQVNGLDNKVRSLICFPIREKDQVVGVFNLSHSRKSAFSDGDKLALSYISSQLGAALTSARFFLKISDLNRMMGEPAAQSFFEKGSPPSSDKTSTFVEVGEVMAQENGIFIYASEKMQRIKEIIDQVANTDVTILIQGESGVGKEVVARSIHLNSNRKDKPFIKVNCAALPGELLESELFGYEKGAFTGAYRQKPGKFEIANSGIIFLDEIGDISPSLQAKLLQVLQDHEFSRLGGRKDVRVDVRVLAATNCNLEKAVEDGRFREDLYYRLNVVNVTIPPLRERKEELPFFVQYFLNKFEAKYQKRAKPISNSLMDAFRRHEWVGNVRELENLIQRFVVLQNEEEILKEISSLAKENEAQEKRERREREEGRGGDPSLKEVHKTAVRQAENEAIRRALQSTNWNRKKAAGLLNISYKSLLNKIKECGIEKTSA